MSLDSGTMLSYVISSEPTNRVVYISVAFDVRQTIPSPQDWVPIQSANGKGALHPPASCLPPPPFSYSNTFTAAESVPNAIMV